MTRWKMPNGMQDALDDVDSTTSKADSAGRSNSTFAEAEDIEGAPPLSPPSSTHSSHHSDVPAADSCKDKPLRPAYLYLDDDKESVPPAQPTDDIKGVPVFTPTMDEFRDFYSYCTRIDEWGMRSGIVKIIPPKEWIDALPQLDGRQVEQASRPSQAGERYTDANRLSQVRIKNSIEQIFTPGGIGVWRQSNVVHPARVVNAKQWADICAQEGQRGPEMRRMKEVARRKKDDPEEDGVRTRSGRGRGSTTTASSPSKGSANVSVTKHDKEYQAAAEAGDESAEVSVEGTKTAQKATSSSRPKMAERTTQEEWNAFDYRRDWCKEAGQECMPEDWAMDTCRAIEQEYWRGLNYGKPPMYGADLAGTLFTPDTRHWNIGSLDNVLTRLRLKRKLPGVTTPYLYFGMWRATFAWHVEDMDLYSINYIHFGAPKQWYSIRQADKQRFELAMASAFPADSSRCRHFMRHKSYLASPAFIESAAGRIKPLRLVQKAQEIVLTYPYGYHSGYNLGFNCAESVNFALERWLDIGRKATYCDCTNDSVKMDVDAMLEESREMEELDRRRGERERKREEEDSTQRSEEEKAEARRAKDRERRKRKKEETARLAELGLLPEKDEIEERTSKKAKADEPFPCEFCPSLLKDDLVVIPDTTDGKTKEKRPVRHAHRLCASFLPETWVAPNPKAGLGSRCPREIVMGVEGIPKARWALKCQNCTEATLQKRGAKVQCTFGRCSRTTHVSCALLEENGWMLDVLPDAEADAIEGKVDKKVSKGKSSTASTTSMEAKSAEVPGELDNVEGDETPRMVVLCRLHNPAEREREAKHKVAVMRVCLEGLVSGQKVRIRTGTGLWETVLRQYEPAAEAEGMDEGEITLEDGSRLRGSRVVFDAETIRKAEDVVWYREEDEALGREASERQQEEETILSAREIQQREREEAREAKKAAQAAKQAERDRRAAEKERKRQEREQAKAERNDKRAEKQAIKAAKSAGLQPGTAVHAETLSVPSQMESMHYIRDWKPRQFGPDHSRSAGGMMASTSQPTFTFPILTHRNGLYAHPSPPNVHPFQSWPASYGTLPDPRMMYAHPSHAHTLHQQRLSTAPTKPLFPSFDPHRNSAQLPASNVARSQMSQPMYQPLSPQSSSEDFHDAPEQ